MVPISLTLENFLSYGEDVPTLDFRNFQIACLSGNNGHGKSSILDAITWALWGEARKGGGEKKADDGLVRIGASKMRVEFDFDLEGNRYRVIRSYSKSSKGGKSNLEFQIYDSNSDSYISISTSSITKTQEKINQTLGMTFETFVNSAFILQGRADEFTKKSARERKEVLSEILGLNEYDRLSERAKKHQKECELKLSEIELRTNYIDSELGKKSEYENTFESLKVKRSQLEKELENFTKNWAELKEKFTVAKSKETQLESLRIQISRMKTEISDDNTQIYKFNKILNDYESVILERDVINSGFETYLSVLKDGLKLLRKKEKEDLLFDRLKDEINELEKLKNEIERKISEASKKIELNIAEIRTEINGIKKETDKESQLILLSESLNLEVKKIDELKRELEDVKEEGSKVSKDVIERDLKQLESIQKDIEDIREKLRLLSARDGSASGEEGEHHKKGEKVHCPLCESELDENKRNKLVTNYKKEIKEKERLIVDLEKLIRSNETRRNFLKEKYTKLKDEIDKNEQKISELAKVKSQLENILLLKDKLKSLEDKFKQLNKMLSSKEYVKEDVDKLTKIENDIKRNGYDKSLHSVIKEQKESLRVFYEHKSKMENFVEDKIDLNEIGVSDLFLDKDKSEIIKLKEKLEKFSVYVDKRRILIESEKRLPEIKSDMENLISRVKNKNEFIQRTEEEIVKIKEEITNIGDLENKLIELEFEIKRKQNERDSLISEMSAVKNKLENCILLENEKKKFEDKLTKLRKEKFIYEKLTTAFGKNGIQSLIIEEAIPEIEQEANAILSRLTDNKTHITIEPLKSTKDGSLKETLDIKISDELGTRNYEMYSGGEAFRTDFAIRIALSKLLARRAGTKLRTLVIDEGFGTQDMEGIEHLVDVINKISSDFDKIIIVTHLDILKNAFPVRIEVTKYPDIGSRFEVMSN